MLGWKFASLLGRGFFGIIFEFLRRPLGHIEPVDSGGALVVVWLVVVVVVLLVLDSSLVLFSAFLPSIQSGVGRVVVACLRRRIAASILFDVVLPV